MDPQKERGRLSEIYAGKTDEELQQVDTQSEELTDIVRGIYQLPQAAVDGARDLLPAP